MTPEGKLLKQIQAYLNKHRIWHYRTQMGMAAGLPDIIAIYRGYFVGLELKRPDGKGKATLQQEKVINDIQEAGGFAAIIESEAQLQWLLIQIQDHAKKSA